MATSTEHKTQTIKLVKISLAAVLILLNLTLMSQNSNSDFERIRLLGDDAELSGIALSPDMNSIAITARKSSKISVVDWNTRKITNEINTVNWNSGSIIRYSSGGKYLLLQEIAYTDFSQNKDRNINFEIIDASTGNSVKKFVRVQDVVISADEKMAVSLGNDEITFWDLPSGTKGKSFSITGAANAIALSPDQKTLAVSQTVNAADFKTQFKKDKRGLKYAVNYRQLVGLWDADSGKKIKTIGEFYEVIYNLEFLPEGDVLVVYQTPDIRVQVSNKKLSYINLVDMEKQEPLRLGFTSMSTAQPELKVSSDKKFFAINSKGNRFQEIHLYNYGTGELEKRFELGHRLFEKVDGEKLISDSHPSFTFLPGNQSILIAIGNQLVKWNIENN
jgi:WD40 repeat protein